MRRAGWLAAWAVLVLGATPAAAATAGTAAEHPLWTALGLGGVIVVAYGVTRLVAWPLLRHDPDEDGLLTMARVEAATLRAGIDDLAVAVATTDAEGRILYANRRLRDHAPQAILPGRGLPQACGNEAMAPILRRVAETGGSLDTELVLSWGTVRLRCLQAADGVGVVVFFRDIPPQADRPAAETPRDDVGAVLRCGPIAIDPRHRRGLVDGEAVDLTDTEFRLLLYFVEHAGVVLTRAQLLRDVWGHKEAVYSRTVDTHVQRLRDKLGDSRDLLQTVRGAGYQLRVG